jgi:hypothetical protein
MLRLHCYLFLFCSTLLVAQNNNPISKKILEAKRVEGKIAIDGNLDENEWQTAVAADSFLTFQPVPGLKASEDGQIRVLFDNEGLFENPQRNIISLKMIYFLDYNSIFSHNS